MHPAKTTLQKAILIMLGMVVTTFLLSSLPNEEKYEFYFEGTRLNASKPFVLDRQSLQTNDYNWLIDIDFRFLILNESCTNATQLLLILVHTSVQNFERRQAIRDTWGFNKEQVKTLFMLGNSESDAINRKVIRENNQFGDIIQGSFVEDYDNLSYKHAMSLKYVLYHCPQTKYALRVDDDVLVNTPKLVEFLKRELSEYGSEKCMVCTVNKRAQVIRTYKSKWRISFKEYERRYYPPYCQGWYVIYSPDVIFQLYRRLQKHRFFKIEDVLVTGIVANDTQYVNHSDSRSLSHIQSFWRPWPKYFLFGGTEFDSQYIRKLWYMISEDGV